MPLDADVLIIGAGPAGLQAAIHAARKKVSVVVVGRPSNSAAIGTHIENYFGIGGVADGTELIRTGVEQAKSFGCTFLDENVISTERNGAGFRIVTENDTVIDAKSVVIATGISRTKLNVPGENELFGKGVSYCASCDCNFYKGKTVMITGGDTEAAVSAELMTRYAAKTYWIYPEFKASSNVIEKAKKAGVEILNESVKEILGDGKVQSVRLSSGKEIATDGVFIELGAKSAADLAMDMDVMPEMDDTIKVNSDCSTSVKGVFACGDITGKPKQIAKAVGQGCIAGSSAADYVRGL